MTTRGRPTLYTEQIAVEVCARLAEGEGLRSICRDDGMPAPSTIINWVMENREGFSERYAKAKDVAAQILAEEIIEIADDNSRDEIPILDDAGNEIGTKANAEFINRSRLRVDTRKWVLSKLLPKKYGDKLLLPEGADGQQLIPAFIMRVGNGEPKD